jgi:hypothetical protein
MRIRHRSIARRLTLALLLAAAAPLAPLAAQARQRPATLPPLLPEEREVALALSAGPPSLTRDAAVLVLRAGGYVRVREGNGGAVCLVERDHPQSLAPVCYDAEASRTILPGAVLLAELRERGLSHAAARDSVLAAYRSGALRAPERLAVGYMLSRGQRLYSAPDGEPIGAWEPHVMLYSPGLTNPPAGAASGEAEPVRPFVMDEGTATAHVIVVAREWSAAP